MILIENKVVITTMDSFEQRENGKLINGSIYPMGEVVEVEVPLEVIPQKYCYTVELGFYINPIWEQSKEQEVQKALDAQILELMEGGLL